jgi:hypothetical protein
MAWSIPRSWIPGEIATAVMMNANVRDNQNALLALFTPWVDVSFDPLDFTADDGLGGGGASWTQSTLSITHNAYFVVQNTLFWSFGCNGSFCSGGSGNDQILFLFIRQPTRLTRNFATSEQIGLVSYLNCQGQIAGVNMAEWICRPISGAQLRMEPNNSIPFTATHGFNNPLTLYFNVFMWII